VVGSTGAESAAGRTWAGWCRRPNRGCRIRASTALRHLLPFRAPEGVDKISPVEASRRYLEHLREAWDARMPDAKFANQQVLVTVPASFDAVARELTLEAAKQAGYRQSHAARRAAGSLLCLDRAPLRLARARPSRRSDSGGRHRRRHHRFFADRGDRVERYAGAGARGGGRPHPARRRQYRPGAGRRGIGAPGGKGHAPRQPADAGAVEQLPHGQGKAAGSGFHGAGAGR
jgi:hypothetical protein